MIKIGWSRQALEATAVSLSLHSRRLAGLPPKLAPNRRTPPTLPSARIDSSSGHLADCPEAFHEMTVTEPMSSSRAKGSGAVLGVPIVEVDDPVAAVDALRATGRRSVGTAAHGGQPVGALDPTAPVALVVGNEARGLDDALAAQLDTVVTVPMPPLPGLAWQQVAPGDPAFAPLVLACLPPLRPSLALARPDVSLPFATPFGAIALLVAVSAPPATGFS